MKLFDNSGRETSTGRSAHPHGKLSLGSFSKVLVSLLILFLAVGCFAGAVSADTKQVSIYVRYSDSYENTAYEKLGLATVSNQTNLGPEDYLIFPGGTLTIILNNTNMAPESFASLFKSYTLPLGYCLSEHSGNWYDKTSGTQIFDDGKLVSSFAGQKPEYITDDSKWNYEYTGDVHLYFILYQNETKIKLNANGGQFDNPDPVNYTNWDDICDGTNLDGSGFIQSGDKMLDPDMIYVEPTRDGYRFVGWMLSASGPDVAFNPKNDNDEVILVLQTKPANAENSANFTIISGQWRSLVNEGEVTLYAKWEQQQPPSSGSSAAILSSTSKYRDTSVLVEYCQVLFEANGAEGTMEQQQFTVGEPRELKLNEFTYPEHTFIGWALEPEGEVVYTDGQEITISKDTTLYAKWIIPLPDIPDVQGDTDENGLPTWVFILIGVIITAIIVLLLYFLVFKRT